MHHARKKNGYTQESLAEQIGVSRGVIFNLEKNKTHPQKIVINAIAQTLGINTAWLLEGVGEMEDYNEVSHSAKILAELYEAVKSLSEDEQYYILVVVKAMKQRLHK